MRVLSIGQCRPDHAGISFYLKSSFAADVDAAATESEALQYLQAGTYRLILVNRVLDADGSDGLALIERLCRSEYSDTPVMLVSNYPDWQQRAVAVGAADGFGKAELNSAATREKIAAVLGDKGDS